MERAQGVIGGLVAAWVKALSEPRLQAAAERILPPSPAQKQEVGADPAGRPDNMPPAVLVARLTAALGHPLTDEQLLRAQQAIHYGFGAGLGIAYGVAARRWRGATRGRGTLAGLAVYAATHASVLPVLGLQRSPWRLPPAAVAWESASHAIFGATLEGARRTFLRLL